MEQKKADENVLRLVEEQKVVQLVIYYIVAHFIFTFIVISHLLLMGFLNCQREKEEALKKILQLEKQLDVKQKLEMEIEDLKGKLQVMKHLGQDDAAVQKKMEEMNNELKDKIDDLQDLESTNLVLICKERQSNDELQEARKVLIQVLPIFSWFRNELYLPKPRSRMKIHATGHLTNILFSSL